MEIEMPNKLSTTVITAAALAFCGQAFAQHSTAQPIDKPPNVSPDTVNKPDIPAERVQPKADTSGSVGAHKSHKSVAKNKSKPSKKSPNSDTTNIAPATGDDASPPTR
jgi:hypothetical protein